MVAASRRSRSASWALANSSWTSHGRIASQALELRTHVPPASSHTEPAIVEVEFEVVEGVRQIDPATGVEHETWGYRVPGSDETISSTPGPMIRARVGGVLRFTPTIPRAIPCPTTSTSTP